jgi:glycosyltransferase involved in cell wall biosynthesis
MSREPILGVHDAGSIGIARYVRRLADACAAQGRRYVPAGRPQRDLPAHFHLGNSSRRVVWQAPLRGRPYVLTVHDVVPRDRRLLPLYRAAVYPFAVRHAAALVVHSRFAADLLLRHAGVDAARLHVIAHAASTPRRAETRTEARAALGLDPAGPPLFVLPGVLRSAKLVDAVAAAAAPLIAAGELELLLAGAARGRQAPDDAQYERALLAADVVVCLRAGSVGETNGPALDALGAGKPLLASRSGSLPEVAGNAAWYVEPDALEPDGIRAALRRLLDAGWSDLAAAARRRGGELGWHAAAAAHLELLDAVG